MMYNRRVNNELSLLTKCELCPRRCGVDRLKGAKGYCGAGRDVVVAHYGAHFGEEPPISGSKGSGNIFFSPCNLRCLFCQNHQISHARLGERLSVAGLTGIFFELESAGVHNINLVSPTPYLPQIALAIKRARGKGLALPFVYNTNSYENTEALAFLDGLVDIYLPDFKYWNDRAGERLSSALSYPFAAREAVLEMKRQVGNLVVQDGLAKKGLLVRHLVLPGNLGGTINVIRWVAEHLGRETWLSLMAQYSPVHHASQVSLLSRCLREEEYQRAMAACEASGMENVFIQGLESARLFLPDFERSEPFERAESNEQ